MSEEFVLEEEDFEEFILESSDEETETGLFH